jgi:hypothetical protein
MPNDIEKSDSPIEETPTAPTPDADPSAPHVPGAGPVILHGARSLTIEFTDGHTIQVSF